MSKIPLLADNPHLRPLQQRIELDLGAGIKPGWFLLSAQLYYDGPELEITLFTESIQGEIKKLYLPVTLKGKLYELVPISQTINKAWLEVKSIGLVSGLAKIKLKTVSWLTSYYIMWLRLYHTYAKVSKTQKRLFGLRLPNMIFNPYPAYNLISKSRYYTPSPSYAEWIIQSERFTPETKKQLKHSVKQLSLSKLKFEVLIDVRENGSPEAVLGSLNSLQQQLGVTARPWLLTCKKTKKHWQDKFEDRLRIISDDDLANNSEFINAERNTWVLIIQPGSQLAPWALAWMATEVTNPDLAFIYSDHDYLVDDERTNPQFKPDWSLELARNSNYIGSAFAVRGDLFSKVMAENVISSSYKLMLDATALVGEPAISHIPAVLFHYISQSEYVSNYAELKQHFHQKNIAAKIEKQKLHLKIRYQLPDVLPKVSIVVPTRDGLHYLEPCITSLLDKTTWPNYEVLIVDNQSIEPATLAYFAELKKYTHIKVLHYDKPFNFSAINNFAVAQASGDIICLLNNDTEVISPDWLEELVSRLLQPEIGIVGARLYFRDGRVQHAGDVLGPGGCATHLHGILEADNPGYMHRAVLAQDLSAVTAACFVTHKALYQQLGGLNEQQLTVAFNDVDYCLKVREAGFRVIYTPYAELYHYESVSRGKDDSPSKQARAKRESDYMRRRWGHIIDRDPFYNPNLNYSQPDFKLGKVPRVDWPW